MEKIEEVPKSNTKGVATVLAIGTANPPNPILQSDYPDFFFRVTNADHLHSLKLKFKRICENTKIEKRHFALREEFLEQNSETGTYDGLSMEKRLQQPAEEVIKLGNEAALKAMKEWGQPSSQITHLIFYTTSCYGSVPSPDYHLAKLLGLKPTINRLMMFAHGCHAGGTVLRVAKDIAENNPGSRVLAVCAETTFASFQTPSASHVDALIGHALFGDGAAVVIVGTNPNTSTERPIFELVLASQTTIPDTENAITGHSTDMGLVYYLDKDIPNIISRNVKRCLIDELGSAGFTDNIDWNKLFYAVHPGGPVVLSKVEEELGLSKEKLRASWHVLREFGNMWSTTVIFVLDELRKKYKAEGKGTTADGLEWGVLLGFGPGLAIETVVLRSLCVKE